MADYEFVEEFDSDDEISVISNVNLPVFMPPNFHINYENPVCLEPSGFHWPSIMPGIENENLPQFTVAPKRKRRRRKHVQLADFSIYIKSQAWKEFQVLSLQKELDELQQPVPGEETHHRRMEITQTMQAIKNQLIASTPMLSEDGNQDDICIRKLINKFKSQSAKRKRQKRAKFEVKSARKKKTEEIDKWQEEQRNIYDKQRRHQLFVEEAKNSLTEIRRKKQLLEAKVRLISSLEKLREVRRKQLINVKAGFSLDSTRRTKSTGNFLEAMLSLRKQVEIALHSVTKEEEMIVVRIQPQREESKSQTKGEQGEKLRIKRGRKWQKYLYKKMLKTQRLV